MIRQEKQNMETNKVSLIFVSEQTPRQDYHNIAYEKIEKLIWERGIEKYQLIKGPHGKPMVCDEDGQELCYISISHCKGLVVCAISSYPVGIDAENNQRVITSEAKKRIGKRLFSEDMQKSALADTKEFLKCWTRYESLGKLLGTGLSDELKLLPVEQFQYIIKEEKGYIISVALDKSQEDMEILWEGV